MSRIGRLPIDVPSGVEVTLASGKVTVKGKEGTLEQELPRGISVAQEESRLVVSREKDTKRQRSEHGLIRAAPGGTAVLAGLRAGARVRILANHSCLTAALHDRYHVVRGDEVVDVWRPCRGW